MTIPRATARLQFHADFTLDHATERVPYYAAMGISHLYASPLASARPGSTHGYDVIDQTRVNPALGGEAALERLVARLREHDMGLILDIVPNHMATHADNAWWWDVWEKGPGSPYAHYFDIGWESDDQALHNKILAPFLGLPYGQALEEGAIELVYDDKRAAWIIEAHGNPYPIAAGTLPVDSREALAARYSAQTAEGRAALHALLEHQFYRLAWWRCAPEEINWRRFFEVSELAGVRVEADDVFDAVHALTLDLYARGLIDGVRVDHVDGLADPIGYCAKLRAALGGRQSDRPGRLADDEAYLVIEKILAHDEELDARWDTHGTTGYDFMSQITAFLHDADGETDMTALWQAVSGEERSPAEVLQDARELMLARHFPVERNATVQALHRVARSTLVTRDISREAIGRTLHEMLRIFPVYRTYATASGRAVEDRARFEATLAAARARMARESDGDDLPVFDALAAWLGGEAPADLPEDQRALRLTAIRRFQQLTPPLAAKSLEDTTFYQYGRLLSNNDVGGEPALFAADPAAFHQQNAWRAKHRPHAMLTTATHDHKRGEDVRARLAVLSEVPDLWASLVERIRERERGEGVGDGDAPSGRDRYMLWQTIVGAWPLDLSERDNEGVQAFAERLLQWQEKSMREAKLDTSWIAPRPAYEEAAAQYLKSLVSAGGDTLAELALFARDIAPAGAVNGLAQVALRSTLPGVPDLYQGTEFWDFSLVDPDNRRPVDFNSREAALNQLDERSLETLLREWRSGAVKQAVISRILALRRRRPEVFNRGDYLPLAVQGQRAQHVFAFLRRLGDQAVVTVVPRLVAGGIDHASPDTPTPSIASDFWGDTAVVLPAEILGRQWFDVVAQQDCRVAADGVLPMSDLLTALPVAVLATQ